MIFEVHIYKLGDILVLTQILPPDRRHIEEKQDKQQNTSMQTLQMPVCFFVIGAD